MLEFIKTHKIKILAVLLALSFARSCSKSSEAKKINKTNIELIKENQAKDSLLGLYRSTIDSFPEKLRKNSLEIHQEYDLWISQKDRGEQLMDLHKNFVKVKIKELSK